MAFQGEELEGGTRSRTAKEPGSMGEDSIASRVRLVRITSLPPFFALLVSQGYGANEVKLRRNTFAFLPRLERALAISLPLSPALAPLPPWTPCQFRWPSSRVRSFPLLLEADHDLLLPLPFPSCTLLLLRPSLPELPPFLHQAHRPSTTPPPPLQAPTFTKTSRERELLRWQSPLGRLREVEGRRRRR